MVLMLLQGCGLKGPLYIPTEQQKKATAERQRLLKEREARRQGQAVPQTAPAAETGPPSSVESDVDLLPDVAPPPVGEPPQMEPAAPPPP